MKILFFVIAFCLISCEAFKQPNSKVNPKSTTTAAIFGWFDGTCFVTPEKNLSPGTEILVVLLDEPQSISSAVLAGPANPQKCGPLSADRRKQNISENVSFYEVKSDTVFDLAIGVIGNVSQSKVKEGSVLADIGNDGNFERFTLCATSEGLVFHVWASLPFKKDPVWSGYYYLGYDVDRTCP